MTSTRSIIRHVAEAFGALGSAGRAAAAVEAGRAPAPGDLRRLGIDAAAFGAIARN